MGGVTTTERGAPLQGGLPPAAGHVGELVEVACDESGFSGSNLLDSATPVFTHASVDLDVDRASQLVEALASRASRSLAELKSGQLLRALPAGDSLDWFLQRLSGHAHVFVVDKAYFLATRVVDLFLAEAGYAAGTRLSSDLRPAAGALHRSGRQHPAEHTAFLAAFADLVRIKRRQQVDRRVLDRFFRARDDLAACDVAHDATEVLASLTRTRVRAVVTRLHEDDPTLPPPLEPLLPALAETVLSWSTGRRQVLVVHDEQSALTAGRLRRLQLLLGPGGGVSPLAGLLTVDSRDDPRVQVADLLAGLARRAPGHDDLRPFLAPTSLVDPEG